MNKIKQFLHSYKICEICNKECRLYFDFENFKQFKGFIKNNIIYFYNNEHYESECDFYYDIDNNSVNYSNSTIAKNLCKYDLYIVYICGESSYEQTYCSFTSTPQLNISNLNCNLSKFSYYTPEQKVKSTWNVKYYSLEDDNNNYVCFNKYNFATHIYCINKNDLYENILYKGPYIDFYGNNNDYKNVLRKMKTLLLLG